MYCPCISHIVGAPREPLPSSPMVQSLDLAASLFNPHGLSKCMQGLRDSRGDLGEPDTTPDSFSPDPSSGTATDALDTGHPWS